MFSLAPVGVFSSVLGGRVCQACRSFCRERGTSTDIRCAMIVSTAASSSVAALTRSGSSVVAAAGGLPRRRVVRRRDRPATCRQIAGHPGLAEPDQTVRAEPGEERVRPDDVQPWAAGSPPTAVRERQRDRQRGERGLGQPAGDGGVNRNSGDVEQSGPDTGRWPRNGARSGRAEQCHGGASSPAPATSPPAARLALVNNIRNRSGPSVGSERRCRNADLTHCDRW